MLLPLLLVATMAVEAGPPAAAATVLAVVLGTAQDGGLPQANCRCERCERARAHPEHRRSAACLALIDAEAGKTFLIDATPDLPEQLDRLIQDETLPLRKGRTPFDGVLLTHAHVGHYTGLLHFGREVMASQGMPLHVSERMADFLSSHGPWSQIVELGQVDLKRFSPGKAITLTPNLKVTPLLVPHRDEYSDTVGFLVEGPNKKLLWLPDIDKWGKWELGLTTVLERVDHAFLDATFYSGDELPGRAIEKIPHPMVEETIQLLGRGDVTGRGQVWFVHLNHSNPLIGPDESTRRKVEKLGFRVADEGDRIPL